MLFKFLLLLSIQLITIQAVTNKSSCAGVALEYYPFNYNNQLSKSRSSSDRVTDNVVLKGMAKQIRNNRLKNMQGLFNHFFHSDLRLPYMQHLVNVSFSRNLLCFDEVMNFIRNYSSTVNELMSGYSVIIHEMMAANFQHDKRILIVAAGLRWILNKNVTNTELNYDEYKRAKSMLPRSVQNLFWEWVSIKITNHKCPIYLDSCWPIQLRKDNDRRYVRARRNQLNTPKSLRHYYLDSTRWNFEPTNYRTLEFSIKNIQGEYLFASYMKCGQGHSVFTWVPKQDTNGISQGVWELIPVDLDFNFFYLRNTFNNEYLYSTSDNTCSHDSYSVITHSKHPDSSRGAWTIEMHNLQGDDARTNLINHYYETMIQKTLKQTADIYMMLYKYYPLQTFDSNKHIMHCPKTYLLSG